MISLWDTVSFNRQQMMHIFAFDILHTLIIFNLWYLTIISLGVTTSMIMGAGVAVQFKYKLKIFSHSIEFWLIKIGLFILWHQETIRPGTRTKGSKRSGWRCGCSEAWIPIHLLSGHEESTIRQANIWKSEINTRSNEKAHGNYSTHTGNFWFCFVHWLLRS